MNVTSAKDPSIIRTVYKKTGKNDEKGSEMVLVDRLGRWLSGNRIQHGKTSSISLGDDESGYKIEEMR